MSSDEKQSAVVGKGDRYMRGNRGVPINVLPAGIHRPAGSGWFTRPPARITRRLTTVADGGF
jgi:hypothetical protein